MQPFEIKKDIYWVGALDWNIRDFHGYSTPKGTTYNAYLVMDEKITLFDTVKKPFKDNLIRNISKIVDPQRVDYLVVNHVEMDHSGSVPEIIQELRPQKVFCSAMGKKALLDHYHREDWPYEVVESGQTIQLGKKSVQFLETRMLHWPDSMMSYFPEDQLLISSDGFGQHWATSQRFDDQVDIHELLKHSAKYYANILLPYSPLVQKLLANVQALGLKIDMIAPDHGLIWCTHLDKIIAAYDAWSLQKGKEKALIIYDTMWHSTEKMGYAIGDGLSQEGVDFQMFNLKYAHRSDIMTEVLDSRGLILGCSTLNNGVLPAMADVITYMRGLRPANKLGAAFGSYGWSGEAVKIITECFEDMKVELVEPGLRVKFAPSKDDLDRCVELGRKVGQAIKAKS